MYNRPPHDQLFDMVQWFLMDIVPVDGEWQEHDLPTPQQQAGSGSCGLAAVSAIASFARLVDRTMNGTHSTGPDSALWTMETSSFVRGEWMQALLRRHLCSIDQHPVSLHVSLHARSY